MVWFREFFDYGEAWGGHLLALSSQMRFAIFLRYTLNCLDAFKDWDAACSQSKLFPWGFVGKCSNVENRQSHNALCRCRCCRWSELGSDLYLCICMQAYAHVKVCLNHPLKDCGEYFGSMPAASLVTTSTSCRQGMLMEVIFGYRIVEIRYYSSYQVKRHV